MPVDDVGERDYTVNGQRFGKERWTKVDRMLSGQESSSSMPPQPADGHLYARLPRIGDSTLLLLPNLVQKVSGRKVSFAPFSHEVRCQMARNVGEDEGWRRKSLQYISFRPPTAALLHSAVIIDPTVMPTQSAQRTSKEQRIMIPEHPPYFKTPIITIRPKYGRKTA